MGSGTKVGGRSKAASRAKEGGSKAGSGAKEGGGATETAASFGISTHSAERVGRSEKTDGGR